METREDYNRECIREHEAQPRESTLGDGCCQMCGRPTGVIELEDGTQVLGCRCMATREQLIAEMERRDGTIDELKVQLATMGKVLASIPDCFIPEERDTD